MTVSTQRVLPVDDSVLLSSVSSMLAGLVILLLAFFTGQIAVDYFRDAQRFPISRVMVEGSFRFTDQDVLRERVLGQVERGFFNLDIAAIQGQVEAMPWVDKAYVRRVWPDTISVTLEEHEAIARWNDDALISRHYRLFYPTGLADRSKPLLVDYVADLPQLQSPQRRHAALLKTLEFVEPLLERVEAPLVRIQEDARRSLSLHLKGDVEVIIGHRETKERVQRFVDVFRSYVAPVYDDVARVDMRHTNGFAMARKSNSATQDRGK